MLDIEADQLSLSLDPESLSIKEICTSPRDCEYRQRCGKLKAEIANTGVTSVTITKILRETIAPNGEVATTRSAPLPREGYVLDVHQKVPLHQPECRCRENDRNCTPEYPHVTHPFLWNHHERITVFYTDGVGEKHVSSTAGYHYFGSGV